MQEQLLLYEDTVKLPEVFSKDHIKKLIETIQNSHDYLNNDYGRWEKSRDMCIFMFLYTMALRPKECCKIEFTDFNLQEGTLRIKGINNKTGQDRVIPVPKETIPFLTNYLGFDRAYYWKGSNYLFPSAQNDHISPGRWKHIFREKIMKPSGLYQTPEKPQFSRTRSYTLRHTKATEILNATHDIFLTANILGHKKLESTKVYIHKSPKYLTYMARALNGAV